MAGLLIDIRFGFRGLVANWAFTVLAVVCLGIGIGASAMTFAVVNGALLQPLGAVDAEGLVGVWEAHESAPNQWLPASWPKFLDWKTAAAEHAQMSALRESSFDMEPSGSGARVVDALSAIPGVETAATSGHVLPLRGGGFRCCSPQ